MADLVRRGVAGPRGMRTPVSLIAVLLLLALWIAPAPAGAATGYLYNGGFGGTCDPACPADGLFSTTTLPQRMAIHQASGKIFVADPGSDRIQVFAPTVAGADYAFSIPVQKPLGVAIDQSTAELYVLKLPAPPAPGGVTKFAPVGDPSDPGSYLVDPTFASPVQGAGAGEVGSFGSGAVGSPNRGGIAVDPVTHDILVIDRSKHLVHRFGSSGTFKESFNGTAGGTGRTAFTNLSDIATTSTGDVVVTDIGTGTTLRVDRFNAAGVLQANLSRTGFNQIAFMGLGSSAVLVAVNPVTDEVFSASKVGGGLSADGPALIYHFENDQLVGTFTAPGNALYGHKTAIAVRADDPGRLYVLSTDATDLFSPVGVPRVQAFNAIRPPDVSVDAVDPDGIDAFGAAVSGSVNPNGGSTEIRFEYRRVGVDSGWPGATSWQDVGSGVVEVPVSATLEGLEPFTDYEVRLSARTTSGLNASSSPAPFKTAKAPPVLGAAAATLLTDQGAKLSAEVNPRGAQTSYWFEYGTDQSYGSRVPADPAVGDAGAGRVLRVVDTLADGLEPDTTYHFRIVAVNDVGMRSEGPDNTFATLAADPGGLQADRTYELATGLPTSGIRITTNTIAASRDGSRAAYQTEGTGPTTPGYDLPYKDFLMTREEGVGWGVTPIGFSNPAWIFLSAQVELPADLSRPIGASTKGIDPDDQNDQADLYVRQPDGTVEWITRSRLQPEGEPQTDDAFLTLIGTPRMSAFSEDGRTVVFSSQRRLLEADPNPSNAGDRLYKWRDGELTLVSRRPDGSAPLGALLGGTSWTINAVSNDGARVFWTDGTKIYIAIEGGDPIEVGTGTYVGAAADGSRVFFRNGGRLFGFDVDSLQTHDLADTNQVSVVTHVADTGRRVYFASTAALNAERSPLLRAPSAGAGNIYLATLGADGATERLSFVASSPDPLDAPSPDFAAASSDGRVLAFGSTAPLTGSPTGGQRQAFVYDAARKALDCVSCPSGGGLPAQGHVNASVTPASVDIGGAFWHGLRMKRYVTDDGTVFFNTRTSLLAADENAVHDVYEFRNGQLRLVSRAAALDGQAVFGGASVDGRTAFFATDAALDVRDGEAGVRKLYAARVGGGFPAPAPPTPRCTGDGCQPDVAEPAGGAGDPPSLSLRGGGNVPAASSSCAVQSAAVTKWSRVKRTRTAAARRVAGQARRATGQRRLVLVRKTKRVRRQAAVAKKRAQQARRQLQTCRRAAR